MVGFAASYPRTIDADVDRGDSEIRAAILDCIAVMDERTETCPFSSLH
jgi:hypothetical protein